MGNEEEEVEEEKAICMEKKRTPHLLGHALCERDPEKKRSWAFAVGSRRNLLQALPRESCPKRCGVWFFSTLAALPGSNNVLGLWGEGFLEAPAEAPWALLGGSWERF